MKSLTNSEDWYKFDQNRSRNNKIIIVEGFNMTDIVAAILNI